MSDEQAIQWAVKELRATTAIAAIVGANKVAPGDAETLPSAEGVYVSAEHTHYREQFADVVAIRVDISRRGTRTDCSDLARLVRAALHQSPTNRKVWNVPPSSVGLRLKACRFRRGAPAGKPEPGTAGHFVACLWFDLTCRDTALPA